jgi:hypothetical protein
MATNFGWSTMTFDTTSPPRTVAGDLWSTTMTYAETGYGGVMTGVGLELNHMVNFSEKEKRLILMEE